jgi:hypothetical protein
MKPARRQVAKALPPRNPRAAGVISPFGAILRDSIRGVHQSKTSFKITSHELRKRASAGGRNRRRCWDRDWPPAPAPLQ